MITTEIIAVVYYYLIHAFRHNKWLSSLCWLNLRWFHFFFSLITTYIEPLLRTIYLCAIILNIRLPLLVSSRHDTRKQRKLFFYRGYELNNKNHAETYIAIHSNVLKYCFIFSVWYRNIGWAMNRNCSFL